MTFNEALLGVEYTIKSVATEDDEMDSFLFSLGCFAGESITVVSRKKKSCIVSIKDARYNIDDGLAETILV